MKIDTNRFWIYSVVLFLTVTGFILFAIVNVNNSSDIPKEKQCPQNAYFNLCNHLVGLNKSNLKEAFPYKMYIDSADYCEIKSIQKHLQILNFINPDAKENQKILVKALTNNLEEKLSSKFKTYNPDTMIMLLQWVNKFQYYKDIDTTNLKFYRMVHRHWYNYVSNKLGQYHDSSPNLKYDYKFKYLVSACQSQNYPPDIRNSSTTKIIDNVVNSKWAYLFKRFWDGTGLLFKLMLSTIILFTFYSYYCVYKFKIKRD